MRVVKVSLLKTLPATTNVTKAEATRLYIDKCLDVTRVFTTVNFLTGYGTMYMSDIIQTTAVQQWLQTSGLGHHNRQVFFFFLRV